MMWFLKVRLTSRSICLISDEKLLACSFIFWANQDELQYQNFKIKSGKTFLDLGLDCFWTNFPKSMYLPAWKIFILQNHNNLMLQDSASHSQIVWSQKDKNFSLFFKSNTSCLHVVFDIMIISHWVIFLMIVSGYVCHLALYAKCVAI